MIKVEGKVLKVEGELTAENIKSLKIPKNIEKIDLSDLKKLDTFGATFLALLIKENNIPLERVEGGEKHVELIKLVLDNLKLPKEIPEKKVSFSLKNLFSFPEFLGLFLIHSFKYIKQFEFSAFFKELQTSGLGSVLILVSLSFLIGVVIAYQSAVQLRAFGAGIFIVDLVGISTFRELAPLLTGIILAGRVSSGYTANVGLRKINEEIDALRVMGLSPVVLLVLPRVLASLIYTPLLTSLSAVAMLLGGAIIAQVFLGIGVEEFFKKLPEAVAKEDLFAGYVKTPFFGVAIALNGVYYGFLTDPKPESLGYSVMRSVVTGISVIILLDAVFSIIFLRLGI
ncbi:MlaE family lipid ABC transporter permease subunit [Aquifex aeolicus]|uniref:ABC transporter permease n=1 Tax=Aquifex aeolicus (strain VF5) TaxID=224324 RepID=O67489_AQUAE|nr:MlaE family lipid ABC transporter permease subunit [Aquifex aeolicus]AAC07457.1 hypothetical protein aq_1530 [Aquifex aeolicus VF5]